MKADKSFLIGFIVGVILYIVISKYSFLGATGHGGELFLPLMCIVVVFLYKQSKEFLKEFRK